MVEDIQIFMLILTRWGTFMAISPGFSMKGIPNLAKLAIAASLSLSAFALAPPLIEPLATGWFSFILLKELLVGAAIGFITQLFFAGIEMAGSFVDFQVGFSNGAIFDPAMGVQSSNYGRVYYWISMCVFFFTNLYQEVIRTVARSFEAIPLMELNFTHFGVEGMVKIFVYVFEIALNLAFPLMIVALLSEVILALLSRTVPQINVLILGMPMKILVSLVVFFFFVPILVNRTTDIFPEMLKYMNQFIDSMFMP